MVNALKRTQETLGRLHDLQVIEHHVAAVQALPPTRRGADANGLNVIARMLADECRHIHARYVKQVPALLDFVDGCTSSVVPSLRRRRPLKMASPPPTRHAAARRA
jgi:hypothetical protein